MTVTVSMDGMIYYLTSKNSLYCRLRLEVTTLVALPCEGGGDRLRWESSIRDQQRNNAQNRRRRPLQERANKVRDKSKLHSSNWFYPLSVAYGDSSPQGEPFHGGASVI